MDGKKKQSIVKRKIDDLIGTISDDDEVPIPSDEEEEERKTSAFCVKWMTVSQF